MNNDTTKSPGALQDTRTEVEKAQDFQHIEITATAPVAWLTKDPSTWRKGTVRNQDGSFTCVAQTAAKILEIDNINETGETVVFSATPIYQARANQGEGMAGPDALSLIQHPGSTLESSIPSQNMQDEVIMAQRKMNADDLAIAEKYRTGGRVILPIKDIDTLASVIAYQKKGVMVFFTFEYAEWNQDVPVLIEGSKNDLGHSVTALDFTLYDNKKSVIIDDSWGVFGKFVGQRVITEDFFNVRNFFAGYSLDLSNDPAKRPTAKPVCIINETLSFGMMANSQVKNLQTILQYEGYFPTGVQITGNMLQITCQALLQWQIAHGITDFQGTADIRVVTFGPKSFAVAKELYA